MLQGKAFLAKPAHLCCAACLLCVQDREIGRLTKALEASKAAELAGEVRQGLCSSSSYSCCLPVCHLFVSCHLLVPLTCELL